MHNIYLRVSHFYNHYYYFTITTFTYLYNILSFLAFQTFASLVSFLCNLIDFIIRLWTQGIAQPASPTVNKQCLILMMMMMIVFFDKNIINHMRLCHDWIRTANAYSWGWGRGRSVRLWGCTVTGDGEKIFMCICATHVDMKYCRGKENPVWWVDLQSPDPWQKRSPPILKLFTFQSILWQSYRFLVARYVAWLEFSLTPLLLGFRHEEQHNPSG